jgi:hypothetical protein
MFHFRGGALTLRKAAGQQARPCSCWLLALLSFLFLKMEAVLFFGNVDEPLPGFALSLYSRTLHKHGC